MPREAFRGAAGSAQLWAELRVPVQEGLPPFTRRSRVIMPSTPHYEEPGEPYWEGAWRSSTGLPRAIW